MNLCQYKNVLGEPNKGVHKHYGLGFAIFDVIGTGVGAYMLSKTFNTSFLTSFGLLMFLAVASHKIFCVDTALNKVIFTSG